MDVFGSSSRSQTNSAKPIRPDSGRNLSDGVLCRPTPLGRTDELPVKGTMSHNEHKSSIGVDSPGSKEDEISDPFGEIDEVQMTGLTGNNNFYRLKQTQGSHPQKLYHSPDSQQNEVYEPNA